MQYKIGPDSIKKRILKNVKLYFPQESGKPFLLRELRNSLRTTNPIYLFELKFQGNKLAKNIIAKVTPEIESEYGGKLEYDMLKILYRHPLMEEGNYSVPRPLDYYDDLKTILIEMVGGEKLSNVVRRKNTFITSAENITRLESLMRDSGHCLKTIHKINMTGADCKITDELFSKIKTNYEYLNALHLIGSENAGKLLDVVLQGIDKIGSKTFPLTKQHGDYNLGNIILKGRGLIVFDFTFSTENVIYNDISQFLLGLDMLGLYSKNILFDYRNVHVFKKRFLEGYFQTLSEIHHVDWLLISLFKLRNTLIHFRNRYDYYSSGNRRYFLFLIRRVFRKKLKEQIESLIQYVNLPLLTS